MERPFTVQSREQCEVNTDPQRRCYNGCHFSSEMVWTPWRNLNSFRTAPEAQASVDSWRLLNGKLKTRKLEYRYIDERVQN